MENYPGNSNKPPVEPKPETMPRVTEGDVIRRKKPLGKRLAETFVGGDAKSVWGYVVFDVLVPAAKDMAADAVSQGIERMLFGETRSASRRGSRPSGAGGNYISYNKFAPGGARREEPRQMARKSRANHDFDDVILATRGEAEQVLDRMYDIVNKYGTCSVADLYDLVGITSEFTDNKWGWTELQGAGVSGTRMKGFLLDLPRPEPIDG